MSLEESFKNLEDQFSELKQKFDDIFKTIHGIEPSEVDTIKQEIAELKEFQETLINLFEAPCSDCKWNLYGEALREYREIIKNILLGIRNDAWGHCTYTMAKLREKLFKIKLDSNIKVTVSRDDGEKGENSKDVISSKENNLSTPECRKDGDSTLVLDPFGVDFIHDGEIDVEEMSNKNLCREESNNDILPPSKPSNLCTLKEQEKCTTYNSIFCLSPKITTCMWGRTKLEEKEPTPSKSCETCDYENNDQDNHPCNDCGALRLHWKPKEPTEKECHEYDFDYNCVKCGKNLLELTERVYLTEEFDSHDTHILVRKDKISKQNIIPLIAKIIEKETIEDYCSSEIIAELIYDKLIEKWEEI